MCSLCGVLAGRGHWADPQSNPEAFGGRTRTHTWQRERQARTQLANRILKHYGLSLADWASSSYVLRASTGATVIVDNLSDLWPAAEALASRDCDPLDDALLATLAAPGGD